MTLGDNLLESLNSWPLNGDRRETLSQSLGNWSVNVTADRNDSVGILVSELTLVRSATDAVSMPVRPWADRIAERVSGLNEPLKVIEVDDGGNEALLRSATPTRRGSNSQFYEVHLSGNGMATVKRFKANHDTGGRREQVSYALTHEVLAKLVDDLVRD